MKPASRVCDFEGVENCMTEAEAKQESRQMPALRPLRLMVFLKEVVKEIMVNITIDNQKISVPSGTTIMEAAAKLRNSDSETYVI